MFDKVIGHLAYYVFPQWLVFENIDRKQSLDSEYAIAFAIASGNNNLVKQLATIAKELGKKDLGPLALYSAGNSSGIDLASKVFSEFSPITSSKLSGEV